MTAFEGTNLGNVAGPEAQPQPKLTKDRVSKLISLEMVVSGEFAPVLEELRRVTGADLQVRPGGYHLSVFSLPEYTTLNTLTEEQVSELNEIGSSLQRGEGVTVAGIGYIDGANSEFTLRDQDKLKKAAYVALEIPALQEFRARVGLPPKDFHITLGLVGSDIHFQSVGRVPVKPNSTKFKDVLAPIPKKADPRFGSIKLPEIQFGSLDGVLKEQDK